jgi:KipI family sensor histidine kinase inhibitor
VTLRRAAADALILYFGDRIAPEVHRRVLACLRRLEGGALPGLRGLIPSYHSLLVRYDPLYWEESELWERLEKLCSTAGDSSDEIPLRQVTIPVWYDPSVGWDLEDLARSKGLDVDEIVALHSGRSYRVYALGFLPGFGYLGSLPEALVTPRLASPRAQVPAGSVAIADTQTAVYPAPSPGGWRILGRTPLRLFDPTGTPPTLLQVGMEVRFEPIGRERFLELGGRP